MFRDLKRDLFFPAGGGLLLALCLIVGGVVYASVAGGSADRLITAMLIDAIMVIGLQIYIGNTGVLSFGHIGFGAVAGYTFAVLAIEPARKSTVIRNAPWNLNEVHLSPMVAGIMAVLVSLLVAVVIGIGLARSGAKSGAVAATVITLALLFVSHELAINWTDLTGGDRAGLSFSIGDTLGSRWPIYIVFVGAVIVARVFAQSRVGRLAQAAREDNLAARAMGVNPQIQQMAALLLSVVVVALAASLRVYEIGNITPKFFFFDYTLLTLVMLIVGGRNSVTGSITGVVVITAGLEFARRIASEGYEFFGLGLDSAPVDWVLREGLPDIVLGMAMLGFMIFRPNGFLNDFELDEWLHRRFGRGPETSPSALPAVSPTRELVLEADDVGVEFGGFRALDGATMTAGNHEIVGLIGPNGAGKTTLVNVITGMVPATNGRLQLDGRELSQLASHEIARAGLVRTFQNLRLFSGLTVRENVEASTVVAEAHRSDRPHPGVDALVAAVGLWDQRDRRADELDYGNSRRLELARAAAMVPDFLLLDEPTSGMSDVESLDMVEQVRHIAGIVGAGVLVTDHDLNFITGICDRIYCLDQGRVIASGTPAEIQANPRVQAAYLGSTAV